MTSQESFPEYGGLPLIEHLLNKSPAAESVFNVMKEIFPDLNNIDTDSDMRKDFGNPRIYNLDERLIGGEGVIMHTFCSLYQTAPPTIDPASPIRYLVNSGSFSQMRKLTVRDAALAAISTAACLKTLEFYVATQSGSSESLDANIDEMVMRLKTINENRDDLPESHDGEPGSSGSGEEGKQGPQENDDMSPGSGGSFGSGGTTRPEIVEESSMKLKLMARMLEQDNLLRIFELMGQMSEIETEIRNENLFNAPGSSELDMGSDILRLTLQETLKPTEILARDLAEETAWMNVNKDEGAMGLGPLAICIDLSGSMNCKILGQTEANRADVATALALSLNRICKNQERHMLIVGFESDVSYTFDCPDGKIKPLDLQKLISGGAWGGTSFRPPLKECQKWIKEHEYEGKADIIFVTDGCAGDTFGGDYVPNIPKEHEVKDGGPGGPYTWVNYYEEHEHDCSLKTDCEICYNPFTQSGSPLGVEQVEEARREDEILWWNEYHVFLHENQVRFWILHLEDSYIDRPLAHLSDKTFMGLEDIAKLKGATRSLFTEMIENRKPSWLS